ncbi:MAG: sulfurtransferase TusA family protein [Gammaproteobacteria bacterium]|nr:sulfurtransferase TusA family protein [Gammaproteobacteria bacterium]
MKNRREPVEWRVDVTGLHCPAPVIRCRATLARMAEGEVLILRATDRDAHREILGLVERFGHRLLEVRGHDAAVEFVILKVEPVRCAGMRRRPSAPRIGAAPWGDRWGNRWGAFAPASA